MNNILYVFLNFEKPTVQMLSNQKRNRLYIIVTSIIK